MPSTLFFGCRTPEKSTRKAGFEVCGRSLRPVFDWERNTPSRQSLPVHDRLCLAFIVCIQAAFKLQVKICSRGCGKIYIHAHTHFSRAPGLKF